MKGWGSVPAPFHTPMGIQISNLVSDAAFDWQEVVKQLVDVQRTATIKPVETEIAKNTAKSTALSELGGLLSALQDSVQAIRSNDIFSARTVSTDTANTTWKSTSSKGAPLGSYTFAVSQLATQAQLKGSSNIGSALATSSDVSGLTIANLRTATAVTAGTFTVNGQQVTVDTTDSLADVFTAISTATSGAVTASYSETTDKVTLTGTGEIILGAANDTSNFLSVFKLANNSTSSVSSSATLGTVQTTAALASAGLATSVSGSGSFSINGVSISFDTSSDTLGGLISRINNSTAGVTAAYDSVNDRMTLTNNSTGDTGISVTDSGGVLAALGLTSGAGAALTRGKNAIFTLNGGDSITSNSNTLDSSVHGISGLSVTVNTQTTQTIQVESDTTTMAESIQGFVDAFNAVQSFIDANTKVTITGTNVETSTLTGDREVEGWGRELRAMAFASISGLSGTIDQLDDLGIDFDGISNQLQIEDNEKLLTALADSPSDVEDFFLTGSTGFVSKFYSYLTTLGSSNRSQMSNLSQANEDLNYQLLRLEASLTSEKDRLTTAFLAMQDAQSLASTQAKALENAFFNNDN